MLPGDLGLKWQLPVKKDKDRVIAHRGKQKVKGQIHTHYKQAWLSCNGQKFRVKCQWKRNEQHRLLCVGSVSREE